MALDARAHETWRGTCSNMSRAPAEANGSIPVLIRIAHDRAIRRYVAVRDLTLKLRESERRSSHVPWQDFMPRR